LGVLVIWQLDQLVWQTQRRQFALEQCDAFAVAATRGILRLDGDQATCQVGDPLITLADPSRHPVFNISHNHGK
jgi:hypothetical protein